MSTQDRLAGLRKWTLRRDDESDPNGRVYWDGDGQCYHSVTRILSSTAPKEQKQALEKWLERPTAEQERDTAAKRGTFAHNHAEYVLKTGAKLARATANKRGLWKPGKDALERSPSAVTRWAIQKALEGAPRVNWSAAGYARGLRSFIETEVTAIHAVEFSIHHPAGFAGTCDALLDVAGTLSVVDWKTSQRERSEAMLENYKCQAGAYSLGLKHLTGIEAPSAAIVVARRTGAPQVRMLNEAELRNYEEKFLERCLQYFEDLAA